MKNLNLTVNHLTDLPVAAAQLLTFGENCNVWCLEGQIGAGKTTLVKEIGRQTGVTDPVNSPTFSIVNEYATNSGQPVYHFDFYRIKDIEEAMDTGCEEYFFSGNLCLIEWPEVVLDLLPDSYLHISIERDSSSTARTLKATRNG